MRIASRADSQIQQLISLAHGVGIDQFGSMVERSLYCAFHNRPECAENQIFLLRSAKASELKRIRFWGVRREEELAFDQLKISLKDNWPEEIANFRLVCDERDSSQLTVFTMHGGKGSTRPLDYFQPKSFLTFKIRCMNSGTCTWFGPQKAIKPFLDFCRSTKPGTEVLDSGTCI